MPQVLDEFLTQNGDSWRGTEADSALANPILEPALTKYQDPTQVGKFKKQYTWDVQVQTAVHTGGSALTKYQDPTQVGYSSVDS
jgi:hypothetical protein